MISMNKNAAYFTYDPVARAYYFAPVNRASPPYRTQRHVTAILDIAEDGTLEKPGMSVILRYRHPARPDEAGISYAPDAA
jgi:hypothetical protein